MIPSKYINALCINKYTHNLYINNYNSFDLLNIDKIIL